MKNLRKSSFASALAVAAFAFAGCAPQTSQWSTIEAPRENKVSLIRFQHSVQFRANEDRMNGQEATKLAGFLRDQNVGYGDQILLLPGSSALAQRRQDAIATVFARSGLRVTRDIQIEGVSLPADEVRVVVGRYVVTPPPCPNWSKKPDEDFSNTQGGNFGCSTATNLGLMVANPGDLLMGQPTSPADGDLAAGRIEAYRRGLYPGLLKGDVSPNSRSDIVKGGGK